MDYASRVKGLRWFWHACRDPVSSAETSLDRSQEILWSDQLIPKGSITSAMRHPDNLSCQRALSVCYSAYPDVLWSRFMEADAPGDAAQVAAQPNRGELKQHVCTVDEKWRIYHMTRKKPDLASPTLSIKTHSPRRLLQTKCRVKALTN